MTNACTCCERTDDRGTQMGLCERCWKRGWGSSSRLRVDRWTNTNAPNVN